MVKFNCNMQATMPRKLVSNAKKNKQSSSIWRRIQSVEWSLSVYAYLCVFALSSRQNKSV